MPNQTLGTLSTLRERAAAVEATLTPQERRIVEYHRGNLGLGAEEPETGRPMTVFAVGPRVRTGPHAGKFASIPGYVPGHNDNKPMTEDQALKHWQKEIDAGEWPLYSSGEILNKRSADIHTIMDVDSEGYVPPSTGETLGTRPKTNNQNAQGTGFFNRLGEKILKPPTRFPRAPEGWKGTDREWEEHPGRHLAHLTKVGRNIPGVPTNVRLLGESLAMSPGERKKNPITAKDYTPEELDTIKDLIRIRIKTHEAIAEMDKADLRSTSSDTRASARRSMEKYADKPLSGEVSYDTYASLTLQKNKKKPSTFMGRKVKPRNIGLQHPELGWSGDTLDATGRVRTSLGQFKFQQLPNGDIEVTDALDFEDYGELAEFTARQAHAKKGMSNPGVFDFASMPRRKYSELRDFMAKAIPTGKGRNVRVVIPAADFSK